MNARCKLFAPSPSRLREELAALSHVQWSGWMRYLFSVSHKGGLGTVLLDQEHVERWTRQAEMPYADLPEDEKSSDRVEADKVIALLEGPDATEEEAVVDRAWNWCLYCEQLVDADDVLDGTDVRCLGCNRQYTCVYYGDGVWGFTEVVDGEEKVEG